MQERHLRVEEDFGREEALVSHVNGERLAGERVQGGKLSYTLVGLGVVLSELAGQVRTHVAKLLLDGAGHVQRLFGGDSGLAVP